MSMENRKIVKCEHVNCKAQEYGGRILYVCQDCRETQRVISDDTNEVDTQAEQLDTERDLQAPNWPRI